MKNIRTLHIYGSTSIQGADCPACGQHAFIHGQKMSCCGFVVGADDPDSLKVEIDKVGVKRKLPPKSVLDLILEDQGHKCFYCGAQFGSYRRWRGRQRLVRHCWDHVTPYSYDHNNSEFVAACRECNAIKHSKMFSSMYEAKTYLRLKVHERTTQAS